jgi:hypothetical protein
MPNRTEGICRICGCTTEKPCRYMPNPHAPPAGQPGLTCEWADKSQTHCTNPACLERAEAE